jgi:predicted DNA-binding transcriptional regulator YafY
MTTQEPGPAEQWVGIREAAQRLGVSIATVRRRIRLGTLEAELQPGRGGQEYRVRLPNVSPPAQADPTQLTTLLHSLLAQLAELQRDLVDKAERAATGEARAELLEAEVERLRAELERARRPWWRFWELGR